MVELNDARCPEAASEVQVNDDGRIQHLCLPRNVSRHFHPQNECLAYTVSDIYTSEECRNFIDVAASSSSGSSKANKGFHYVTEASFTAPDGSSQTIKIQNPNPHKLSVFENKEMVAEMWSRLQPHLIPHLQNFIAREQCGNPVGLNPRLRVLKYDAQDNDSFDPHYDATTHVGDQTSLLTVLLYLNEGGGCDFEGGETLFLDSTLGMTTTSRTAAPRFTGAPKRGIVPVTINTGKVVIFEHDLYHSGSPLRSGTKFVLRTDVMFNRTGRPGDDLDDSEEKKESCAAETVSPVQNGDTATSILGLCREMQLTAEQTQVLSDLGILDVSVDSFCAPGRDCLRLMIQDCCNSCLESGDSNPDQAHEVFNRLINRAFEILNSQN